MKSHIICAYWHFITIYLARVNGIDFNEMRTATKICIVKYDKKQLQHFKESDSMSYGTLKGNIDNGRWSWSILIEHHIALTEVLYLYITVGEHGYYLEICFWFI